MDCLQHYKIHLVGIPKLIVEVDTSRIKGMLRNPDAHPNAPINYWIQGILIHDFELIHILGKLHKVPDALSQQRYTNTNKFPQENLDDSLDGWITPPPPYIKTEEQALVRVGIAQQKDKEQEI
jgi:hypothetical protein